MNGNTQEQNIKVKLTKEQIKRAIGNRKQCILDPEDNCILCGDCLMCDLDENKLCINCGKCLDSFNTDEKGFVKVKIDKIIPSEEVSLEDLYKQYGLDGDDD